MLQECSLSVDQSKVLSLQNFIYSAERFGIYFISDHPYNLKICRIVLTSGLDKCTKFQSSTFSGSIFKIDYKIFGQIDRYGSKLNKSFNEINIHSKILKVNTRFCSQIKIPISQIEVKYLKSSGPGGQNVNKTNSKVEIRFDLKQANWISEFIKGKLEKDFSYNINKTGCFILTSDKYRHGYQNFSDCISKLENIIAEASKPEPCMSLETIEIIKKRIKKASIKRVDKKRNKSYVKKFRSSNIKDFE
ncbi:ICT1 [Cordylochernes scorpioides]|uniref:Large ribosomal subunit protein mL62 n=1 Tax=Cordylochernes scorpioides TaxID=51811 RepID=A0ABY6LFS6_9ARAC|nr:ICT1 [Cordylochernes scorpioides]